MKKQEKKTESNWQRRQSLRKSGISQKKAESGTKNIQKTVYLKQQSTISQKFANFVKKIFSEQQCKDFVQCSANERQEQQELINSEIKSENAKIAGKNIKQERQNKNIVQINANANFIGKANVYNLTVENAGCFYANGILVSNCDSLASLIRVMKVKKDNRNSLLY